MADSRVLLHLPFEQWPMADQSLWINATSDTDPFSEAAGARLAASSKAQYWFAWRRFLGFVAINEPSAIELSPVVRLSRERVRAYVDHLNETRIPRSVAIEVDALYKAARVMMPEQDLTWLKSIKARLHMAAPLRQAGRRTSARQSAHPLGRRSSALRHCKRRRNERLQLHRRDPRSAGDCCRGSPIFNFVRSAAGPRESPRLHPESQKSFDLQSRR